jgi:hypothetical protein
VPAGRGVDDLGGNADTVATLADAAFQHVLRAEVPGDMANVG